MPIPPPGPELGASPCLRVAYGKGGGLEPSPVGIERYPANASDPAVNRQFSVLARLERTVRRPSLAREGALFVARCPAGRVSIVLIAGGPLGHERLPLSGWPGATAVDCPPTRAGENAATQVKARHVGSGSAGRWRAFPTGAESEFSFVSWRRRHAVPKPLRRTAGQEPAPPSPGQHSRFGRRCCSGLLESANRPAPLRHAGRLWGWRGPLTRQRWSNGVG